MRKTTEEQKPTVSKHEHIKSDTTHGDNLTATIAHGTQGITSINTHQTAVAPVKPVAADGLAFADTPCHNNKETERTDTPTISHNDAPLPDLHTGKDRHIADLLPEKTTEGKGHQQRWAVDLAFTGSTGGQNTNHPFAITEMETTDDISSNTPVRDKIRTMRVV